MGQTPRRPQGYLKSLLKTGALCASGPVKGYALRSGFLIFLAQSREEVEEIVSKDPFALNGLVVSLTINEWDPVVGMLHDESSRSLPAWDEMANDSWRLSAFARKRAAPAVDGAAAVAPHVARVPAV